MKIALSQLILYVSHRNNQHSASNRGFGMSLLKMTKNLVIDPFCYRQFAEHENSRNYGGTIFSMSIQEFEERINLLYDERKLIDGYAPFCKHVFVENFSDDARLNVLPITFENEHLIRTKYDARTELELPVLIRYFPKESVASSDQPLPVAKYLDLILYSREQIQKENAAMGKKQGYESTAPWGVVSIKAQDVGYEIPMNPITMMRNALGKEHGGSGVPLDRDEYNKSFIYWNDHAVVS